MGDRFLVGVHGPRSVSGLQQVARRPLRLVRLREVVREQPVRLRQLVPVHLLERRPDDPMQFLSSLLKQARIGRLLH